MGQQVPIIKASDNRNAIIVAILYLLFIVFLMFFIKHKEPDPPKVTVPVPIVMEDTGITDFEIDSGGGGEPSAETNPVPAPVENPREQPTQEESPIQVNTGTGASDSENTTSEDNTPANPFSGSGSSGSGNSGSGGGFGSDVGPGSGSGAPGRGMVGDRVRTSNIVSKPKTPNDENCVIALKLVVDSRGVVVFAEAIREHTTTTNQLLINEVIDLVKKEVRYKEKPGALNETAFYTVTVRPG